MKYIATILLCLFASFNSLQAQTQEIQQLLLNYTKLLQLEEILDNMHRGYKILSTGYNSIKNIAEGNFNLHKVFLDGLYAVSPTVKKYKRIPQIIEYQKYLVREYKMAFNKFQDDSNLTVREIKYIEHVYSYLFKESLRNLDELITIITAKKLRMSDEERLKTIDRIHLEMEEKVTFLKLFNSSTQVLITRRAQEQNQLNSIQKLHSLTP